ncbi:MAG: hypothetical protein AAF203_00520 [Pseudomonadota bacterium]
MRFLLMSCFFCLSCTSTPDPLRDSAPDIKSQYSSGKKIVMVSHPHCHFSRNALTKMDPEIKTALQERGLILAPIQELNRDEHLSGVLEWNQENPKLIHTPVLDTMELENIDLTQMPQFYFFSEGELSGKVIGWPKDGSNAQWVRNEMKKLFTKK